MKIRLLRSVVTSQGVHDVNEYSEKGKPTGGTREEIVEIPDAEARPLIARGIAEAV
ncbi:MAG TPA: hypothetical protein VFB13_17835 [Reyranella sp.]|nr:hypothetical protein [Reyranella sp.]